MCDLKKIYDFISSCALKENDGRAALKNIVYDKENGAIIGTDGRRMAVLFVDASRIAGTESAAARFSGVIFNDKTESFSVYALDASDGVFPEGYKNVIPGGLDRFADDDYFAHNDKLFVLDWRNEAANTKNNSDYERAELPAGLCVALARLNIDIKPKYLNLPVLSNGCNEWDALNDGADYSPLVLTLEYNHMGLKFRLVYCVMPFRGGRADSRSWLANAENLIEKAFAAANVPRESWRIVAGRDPRNNTDFLDIMFKKPGDKLEYLGQHFSGVTWEDVSDTVKDWIDAAKH